MTPQERELLDGLFARLKQNEPAEKDAEAAALIRNSIARQPSAAYTLVQAVMVQEHALSQAAQRIETLEKELAAARVAQPAAPAQPSFLGAKATGPWGRPAAPQQPMRATMVPPPQAQSPYQMPLAGQNQGQGGTFLRTALGAAAGFVGGAMLMKGLEGMFGNQAQAAERGAVPLPENRPEPEAWNPVQEHADYAPADIGTDDNF